MITIIQNLPVGNGVRIMLTPLIEATRWRLLRRTVNSFAGFDDPSAVVVYDGSDERMIIDWFGVLNGLTYYYALYQKVGATWVPGLVRSITPGASDSDMSVDVLSIVRERIDMGLQVDVARGTIVHKYSKIQVLTAPPLYDNTVWPMVTVHCNSDGSGERGIGDTPIPGVFDEDSFEWSSFDGWLSRWSVGINCWCQNPDERILMRKAIKRIVIGNLGVFDAVGMLQVDIQQQDMEDFERYSAPVYQSIGTLTCLAPSLSVSIDPAIVAMNAAITGL